MAVGILGNTYGITPADSAWCIRLCDAMSRVNTVSKGHSAHLNDFSPACVRSCFVRLDEMCVAYGHRLHLKGFSPVCSLACVSTLDRVVERYPHTEHACMRPASVSSATTNAALPDTTLRDSGRADPGERAAPNTGSRTAPA